jgi:hypothetical protein
MLSVISNSHIFLRPHFCRLLVLDLCKPSKLRSIKLKLRTRFHELLARLCLCQHQLREIFGDFLLWYDHRLALAL